jgi:hypothetical protein
LQIEAKIDNDNVNKLKKEFKEFKDAMKGEDSTKE